MITKKSFIISGSAKRPTPVDLHFRKSDEKAPVVIFVHGFKGFKDWGTHNLTASYFAERGLRFLKFNFSHNGTTPQHPEEFTDLEAFGLNTFSKELSDLDRVISYACSGKDFHAPDAIYLIGHSRGGGISIIQAAEDQRVTKLVTWASVSHFRSLWMTEQEEEWRKSRVIYVDNSRTNQKMPLNIELLEDLETNAERLDLCKAARNLDKPWLIIHGDNDKTVPVAQAEELASEKNDFLLIRGADHVFGAKHPWDKGYLPEKLKEACDASINFLAGPGY